MVSSKQVVGGRRKDVADVEGMDKFGDGMTLVTGSEKGDEDNVMENVGSVLGNQSGIEETFVSYGECGLEVERGLASVKRKQRTRGRGLWKEQY